MASDRDFLEYVCDQANGAGTLTYRRMFGEYALYLDDKVVALVCDNRLFVKPTDAGRRFLVEPKEGQPYPGAKPWFLADELLDDGEQLATLLRQTARDLPPPKPRKPRKGKTRAARRD